MKSSASAYPSSTETGPDGNRRSYSESPVSSLRRTSSIVPSALSVAALSSRSDVPPSSVSATWPAASLAKLSATCAPALSTYAMAISKPCMIGPSPPQPRAIQPLPGACAASRISSPSTDQDTVMPMSSATYRYEYSPETTVPSMALVPDPAGAATWNQPKSAASAPRPSTAATSAARGRPTALRSTLALGSAGQRRGSATCRGGGLQQHRCDQP